MSLQVRPKQLNMHANVSLIAVNDEDRSSPTNDNRAGVNRWISERRAALETAVDYWRAKHGENEAVAFHGVKGHVVWAGLEPVAFRALFPNWSERADVREINIEVSQFSTLLSLLILTISTMRITGWSHRCAHVDQ